MHGSEIYSICQEILFPCCRSPRAEIQVCPPVPTMGYLSRACPELVERGRLSWHHGCKEECPGSP